MRYLKLSYLSCCLFSLSLAGCAQHTLNTTANGTTTHIDQRAIQALNGLYETTSYDFQGQLSVQTKATNVTKKPAMQLDRTTQKKVEALLTPYWGFSTVDKKHLYRALAQSETDQDQVSESTRYLLSVLNDVQFSYTGSVDYRQKRFALDLNIKYEKPTLLVNAKVPMVVDFKQYKFYSNYFALMPFLVNKDSQNAYAYVDFSKFKPQFERINMTKLVEYLKQNNALAYILAQPADIQPLALSATERQQGIQEKIRLHGDLDHFVLQQIFFTYINQDYLAQQVLMIPADELGTENEKNLATEADAVDLSDKLGAESYQSYKRIAALIGPAVSTLNPQLENDDSTSVCSSHEDVCESASTVTASEKNQTRDEDEALEMSPQDCRQLVTAQPYIPVGALTQCQHEYDINLLDRAASDLDLGEYGTVFSQLEPLFKAERSSEFKDAAAFQKIWQKHQAAIYDVLKREITQPFILQMDLGLDRQGRLFDIHYMLSKPQSVYGDIAILSHTQFKHYGHATAVDAQALKNAKSIQEVTKGSIFEKMLTNIFSNISNDQPAIQDPDFDQQLHKMALATYEKTGSYLQTYQLVYQLLYAKHRPAALNYYSVQDLQEIAELSAYHFNPDLAPTQNTKQQRIAKLVQKHQLLQDENFDRIGVTAADIVDSVVEQVTEQAEQPVVKKAVQAIKSQHMAQVAFSQHYLQLFTEQYELEGDQQAQLKRVANILAQAFIDDIKGKLSRQSLQGLQTDDHDFIDYAIYMQSYVAIGQQWPN